MNMSWQKVLKENTRTIEHLDELMERVKANKDKLDETDFIMLQEWYSKAKENPRIARKVLRLFRVLLESSDVSVLVSPDEEGRDREEVLQQYQKQVKLILESPHVKTTMAELEKKKDQLEQDASDLMSHLWNHDDNPIDEGDFLGESAAQDLADEINNILDRYSGWEPW